MGKLMKSLMSVILFMQVFTIEVAMSTPAIDKNILEQCLKDENHTCHQLCKDNSNQYIDEAIKCLK